MIGARPWATLSGHEPLRPRLLGPPEVIPLGTQTHSKAPREALRGVEPCFIARGSGCRVRDVDGNEYIDFRCGLGPIYAYPLKTGGEAMAAAHRLGRRELMESVADIAARLGVPAGFRGLPPAGHLDLPSPEARLAFEGECLRRGVILLPRPRRRGRGPGRDGRGLHHRQGPGAAGSRAGAHTDPMNLRRAFLCGHCP